MKTTHEKKLPVNTLVAGAVAKAFKTIYEGFEPTDEALPALNFISFINIFFNSQYPKNPSLFYMKPNR